MNRSDGTKRYEKFIKKDSAAILKRRSMFSADAIPPDARNVIDEFDKILQSVFPANGRQLASLPKHINALSHALTDERGERRRGYMNAPETLSAYVRYFSWWNIVRFMRLFANFEKDAFALSDGDACLDVGSGPLTAVISLWLSRPELRNKKLTWYCMDISQASLALGEDLYLSIAARVPPSDKNAEAHWNIVRVKGELGEPLRQKASLIVCADMLNELRETDARSDEIRAKQYASSLLSYAAKKCALLVIEPGVPSAARIISLMRDTLLKKNMTIVSPCPHAGACPMNGYRAHTGSASKWCNFAFSTEDAPPSLLKLSKDAKLPKTRAVVSFLFARNAFENGNAKAASAEFPIRIVSDAITLPGRASGHYACSPFGLTLAVPASGITLFSGDRIAVGKIGDPARLPKDEKTGAPVITV
ncbi:small ribosomal subunit Rsm22 family protein [Treponema socranskii]|uniref:small ribosomal subunit Rsm22 family protein n=1 Tax=Treponema socranskii TaxID=53419 RepID=UPI003D8D45E2